MKLRVINPNTTASMTALIGEAARCWPRRSFVLRPGVIDISIGRPIPPAGRQPDEMMREVERWIESEMRRLDPEAYAPPAPAAQPT